MDFKIDMVRLSTKISASDFAYFLNANLIENPYVEMYIGKSMREYHYNFKIHESLNISVFGRDMDNKFYLAYKHNSEKTYSNTIADYALVVEYNPNKCIVEDGLLGRILRTFFSDITVVKLASCDVCCDLYDVHIDNCIIDKRYKNNFKDFQIGEGRTFYLGSSGSNGSVKIYNKAAERKLDDMIWTRWETTLRFSDVMLSYIFIGAFKIDCNLPTVYFDGAQTKIIDDAKLMCVVHCVKTGVVSIDKFNPRYREKIRPYLEDTAEVVISNESLPDIRKSIIRYFKEYASIFYRKGD